MVALKLLQKPSLSLWSSNDDPRERASIRVTVQLLSLHPQAIGLAKNCAMTEKLGSNPVTFQPRANHADLVPPQRQESMILLWFYLEREPLTGRNAVAAPRKAVRIFSRSFARRGLVLVENRTLKISWSYHVLSCLSCAVPALLSTVCCWRIDFKA